MVGLGQAQEPFDRHTERVSQGHEGRQRRQVFALLKLPDRSRADGQHLRQAAMGQALRFPGKDHPFDKKFFAKHCANPLTVKSTFTYTTNVKSTFTW